MPELDHATLDALKAQMLAGARALGFDALKVADTDLSDHEPRYRDWLAQHYHGEMAYLEAHLDKRLTPSELVPETGRVLVARMNYLPVGADPVRVLEQSDVGYVSRYALGRDYHKVVRRRLAKLATQLNDAVQPYNHHYRAFADSAPVLEKALAAKSGHGWVGRHSLILNADAGSWFFLGEIFTNVPLPVDPADDEDRCGACRACINVCPTDAILPNRTIDARRCISYLTIEHKSAIPLELRAPMGNRVFGCDDCQLYCPWNRDAETTTEPDYTARPAVTDQPLATLFEWSEAEYLRATEGTPLRRAGYEQWQRNVAVALGNAGYSPEHEQLLRNRLPSASPLVAEHIQWALDQLAEKKAAR